MGQAEQWRGHHADPKGVPGVRTEFLIEREVQQVLDLLTYENRLVMRLLLHTGIRIGDALQLKPEQLKPNFWITEQKTGKRR